MARVVTLYQKPVCPQCTASERKLNELNIPFSAKQAMEQSNLEFIMALGHKQAPVVTVEQDGTIIDHWAGYRPDKIGALA